jgi:hypothetical protein
VCTPKIYSTASDIRMKYFASKGKWVSISFVFLLIVTFSINYSHFLFFRLSDFIMMAFLVWGAVYKKEIFVGAFTTEKKLVVAFFVVFFASLCYGLVAIGIVKQVNFAFIYKYLVVFAVFIVSKSILDDMTEKAITRLMLLLIFIYVLLIINIFIDIYHPIKWLNLKSYQVRYGGRLSSIRPAFPFSNSPLSDAHLYAAFLTNMMILLISFLVFNVRIIKKPLIYLIILCSFAALILTGARASLILFFLFGGFLSILKLIAFLQQNQNRGLIFRKLTIFVTIAFMIAAIFWMNRDMIIENKDAWYLIKRMFDFTRLVEFRLPKIMLAVNSVILQGPILIGIGMPSSTGTWFDNAVAAVLVSSGVVGLLLFSCIILVYLYETYKKAIINQRIAEFWCLFFVVSHYVLINVISTEFFLATRSIVPFAILCGMLTSIINKQKTDHLAESTR